MARPQAYFSGLDGIRGIAVLIVFVSHAGFGHFVPGGFGVTIFFFLSGFLITSLLIREQDRYGTIALAAFSKRRIVRLMPPLLITLCLAVFAVWIGLARGDLNTWKILSQIFFLSNYVTLMGNTGSSVEGLNILWSLSVEEQFYLLFPIFFIAFAKSKWIVPIISGALLLALIWRMIRWSVFGDGHYEIYISTDTRIDSILYGCLLAFVCARLPNALQVFVRWRYFAVALALIVLVLSFAVRDPMFRATVRYSLQGLALIPIFYLAVYHSELRLFAWLNWPLLRQIGRYSYTFYLVHLVIINMLIFNGIDRDNLILLFPLSFLLSLGYSHLMYYFVERPLHPVRARLTGHA